MTDQPQIENNVTAPKPALPKEATPAHSHKEGSDESSFSVMVGQVYDGPLDLLLDLIRKQDIDIYDIPIARITEQYLKYVENMPQLDVDVAAEFIYTASLLIHIKSKMLLPRDPDATGELEDPRHGARQPVAGARTLPHRGANAPSEAADRRSGLDESGHERISRRGRSRTRTRRRRRRSGQDVSANPESSSHQAGI